MAIFPLFWLTNIVRCDGCTTLLAVVVNIFAVVHPKEADAKENHATVNLVIKDSVGMMFAFETPSAEWLLIVGHHFLEKILAWWNLIPIVMPTGTIVIDNLLLVGYFYSDISYLPSLIVNSSCCLRIWYVAFFRRHRHLVTHR